MGASRTSRWMQRKDSADARQRERNVGQDFEDPRLKSASIPIAGAPPPPKTSLCGFVSAKVESFRDHRYTYHRDISGERYRNGKLPWSLKHARIGVPIRASRALT